MSTKKTIKEQAEAPGGTSIVVEMPPELTAALEKLADKLDKLDISIDYLTAAVTGEDPLSISIGQSVGGRWNRPMPRAAAAPELTEIKKAVTEISELSLLQLIRKEFKTMLKEGRGEADETN